MDQECLKATDPETGYSTSDSNLLNDFYAPLLGHSERYDRSAGYFSSALIALAPMAYTNFINAGGRMRLVCSPHLSEEDALRLTPEEGETSTEELLSAITNLMHANDLSQALTVAMASLLRSGVLQIKFATPVDGNGLFHDKVGIFTDACGDTVSFVGSANETVAAWSGLANHEQIEVFCSWRSVEQADRIRRHERQFEELWRGLVRGLRVMDATTSAAIITKSAPAVPLDEALGDLRDVIERLKRTPSLGGTGLIPSARPLMEHQRKVLEAWSANDYRGIIAFATGGGKTLAAIDAIRRWADLGGRSALVLVPSELLHAQWEEEIRTEIPGCVILKAGAGAKRSDWVSALPVATAPAEDHQIQVTLATYQTASTPDFITRIRQGDHLLLVADEVHRMGAPDCSRLFQIQAGGRLGLSATPERYNDSEGTARIFDYFGEILNPRFELADAIKAGRLVPYDYFLEEVGLDEDELSEWRRLTQKLMQEIGRSGEGQLSDRAKWIARERAAIIKSARQKTALARRVIEEYWRDGDRWLIYCDSRVHLDEVRQAVESLGHPTFEYHSGNSYLSDEILGQFTDGGILLAIKCLDEGVDIPIINKALILASTTNPREYVQRRGRVLRHHANKYSATIIDVAVVDDDGAPLSLNELRRAREFAELARNVSGLLTISKLEMASGIDPEWGIDSVELERDEGDGDVN